MIDYDKKHDILYVIVEDETNSGDSHNDDIIKFTGFSISKIAKKIGLQPVVHGHWLRDGDFIICSRCESEMDRKNSLGADNYKNYCPNCGAEMEVDNG